MIFPAIRPKLCNKSVIELHSKATCIQILRYRPSIYIIETSTRTRKFAMLNAVSRRSYI